jgi:hypothetical protein
MIDPVMGLPLRVNTFTPGRTLGRLNGRGNTMELMILGS